VEEEQGQTTTRSVYRNLSFFRSLFASIFDLNIGSSCYGVDLNRNYDVVGFGVRGSANPCDESYKGETPNSEPEVKAASNVVMRNKDKLKASLSFHSYGIVVYFGAVAKVLLLKFVFREYDSHLLGLHGQAARRQRRVGPHRKQRS
jgi:hypothetical protein